MPMPWPMTSCGVPELHVSRLCVRVCVGVFVRLNTLLCFKAGPKLEPEAPAPLPLSLSVFKRCGKLTDAH